MTTSSGPWVLVEFDFSDACEHFGNSVEIFNRHDFKRPGIEGYESRMALMHAMQCGHTSFENGILKILRLLDEPFPKGENWHRDLIIQASADTAERKAILGKDLAGHAQITRSFRNVATRAYSRDFDPLLARPAVSAAAVLSQRLPALLEELKRRFTPGGE